MFTENDLGHLRIGAYVRISTDSQDGGSQNQRSEIDRVVARHRLTVVETYADDEGKNPRGRLNPEFQRMMKDAEKGKINAIVIAYSQRLGFIGPDIVTEFLGRIRQLDIPCWDIWERRDLRECYSDSDLWRKVVEGTVRSLKDLEDLAHKQLERHYRLATQGRIAGGKACYGIDAGYFSPKGEFLYRIVHLGGSGENCRRVKVMADGTRIEYKGKHGPAKDNHTEVWPMPSEDETRLAVVRNMFEVCDKEGLTPYQIARRLNTLGHRTLNGTFWYGSIIEHYLRDPVWIGRPDGCVTTHAKYARFLKDGGIVHTNNQRPKHRPSDIGAVMPDDPIFEPVIDPEQFWRVQDRLDAKKRKKTYASRNADAWASGLVFCGRCGGGMSYTNDKRHSLRYWRCNSASNRGHVNATGCGGLVNDQVLKDIVEKYLADTKQQLQMSDETATQEDCLNDTEAARMKALGNAIEEERSKMEALAQKVIALPALGETEAYSRAMAEQKRRIADLEWERKELQKRPTREEWLARIEALEKAKAEGQSRRYNECLRTIIERIECELEKLPPEGRRYNRQYSLKHVFITPMNALEIAGTLPMWYADPRADGVEVQALFIQPPKDKSGDNWSIESLTYNQAGEVCPVFERRMALQGT